MPAHILDTNSASETTDPPRAKIVKASFNLPEPELDALRRVARLRHVNVTQALRQAIAILAFLADLPRGSRVLVEDPDGSQREIVFNN